MNTLRKMLINMLLGKSEEVKWWLLKLLFTNMFNYSDKDKLENLTNVMVIAQEVWSDEHENDSIMDDYNTMIDAVDEAYKWALDVER